MSERLRWIGTVLFAVGVAWGTATAALSRKVDDSRFQLDSARREMREQAQDAKLDTLLVQQRLIVCHLVPATLGCRK